MTYDSPARSYLSTWMAEHGVTQTDLAADLGISRATVGLWLRGETRPKRPLVAKLERMTAGQVRSRDWFTHDELAPDERGEAAAG